jgi:hypothetical protein
MDLIATDTEKQIKGEGDLPAHQEEGKEFGK